MKEIKCNSMNIRYFIPFNIENMKEIKSILKEKNERDKALNIENHD